MSGNLKYDMALPEPTPFSAWLAEECKRRQRWPVIVGFINDPDGYSIELLQYVQD